MKNILKNPENAERLLELTVDTLILLDKDGICVDVAPTSTAQWFITKERLLGKNLFELLPSQTYSNFYPEFRRVLLHKVVSTQNYSLTLQDDVYYFKCIMQPYDGMVLCQYRDITERSQRKLELEKRTHELFEIQKAALIGKWSYNSKIELFSYMGHTNVMCTLEEQFISLKEYLTYIVSDDQQTFLTWLEKNVQGSMEQSVDYRLKFKDNIHYIRLKAFSRERQRNGNILLEGYIQNITDIQKQRNDITLLTHAINNSTEDVIAIKKDGSLVFANRQFKKRHEIERSRDITKMKIYDLRSRIHTKESWQKTVEFLQNRNQEQSFIVHNPFPLRPDILAYECIAFQVTSDKGEEIIWISGKDISQRIRQEKEVKRFNQILDKTLENLPASIVVKDVEQDFRYLYRNRASYDRDIPIVDSIGKNDFDYYPPQVAKKKREEDLYIAETGEVLHWIEEAHDSHNNPLFLDKRKLRIESQDFQPLLLSIEWDITELELMKQELIKAKEKAETSDQLKSAFLANMSHEIRTPLNAIVGFSRIIAESNNMEERKEYYSIVEANNERLLQLINEILDLSKIEAGMTEFKFSTVWMHQLCLEVRNTHLFRCPPGIELIFESSDPDVRIDTDRNRLVQVITNLIGNALKFTQKGHISFGYKIEGDQMVFHVTDTGMGIPQEQIDKIFDRFIQANTFIQGTGLGLSICKTIVERLGGTISLTSELGVGSTFTFTLPLQEPKKKTSKELQEKEGQDATSPLSLQSNEAGSATTVAIQESEPGKDSTKMILVAEDMDSSFMLIKKLLGDSYKLARAKDGIETVNMLEEMCPDLILMDIKMPNLNGLDATRVIRELCPTLPIVIITASAYESDRKRAFECGCSDFLTKPFTQDELRAVVSKWI